MQNKNNLPLIIGISIAIGIIAGSFFNIKNLPQSGVSISKQTKLNSVIEFIEEQYVDDVDTEEIIDNVITDVLDQLDPHSSYLPKSIQQLTKETMNGNFVGIGVQFNKKNDTVQVVKVIPDGPSEKAGIRDGDRLLIANQDTLYNKNLSNTQIMGILKGEEDTTVNIKVYRKVTNSVLDFKIKRGKVAIKSVPVSYKLNDSLGYIKLIRFSMTSYKEFKKALNKMQKEGIKELVLDLRGNPGGFIHIAKKIADEFLSKGKMIVYTKNKNGRQENYVATSSGSFENGHVYVLVDENSASASEILAGALQDHDKGTIVGRRTFGKGLVQQELGFNDGSAMRLTIARYYTPTGRSIQKPYEKSKKSIYDDEVSKRYLNGELFHKDSIKVVDSLLFKTPKGKTVYGGGGIVPDVFIPLDTTQNKVNFIQQNAIYNFVHDYIDNHRKELEKFNANNFETTFSSDSYWKDFLKYNNNFITDETLEKQFIKEYFADALIGDTLYYKISQRKDSAIKKVLEISKQH